MVYFVIVKNIGSNHRYFSVYLYTCSQPVKMLICHNDNCLQHFYTKIEKAVKTISISTGISTLSLFMPPA